MVILPWPYPSDYGPRRSTTGIVIHHTAGESTWRLIDLYHRSLGWGGIGYNIGIDTNGNVTVFGVDDWRAHTLGYNDTTIGVAFMCVDAPNDLQLKVGREVIAWLREKYGNIPLHRHSKFTATACPGGWNIDTLEEETMTEAQKQEVLDHLAVIWGLAEDLQGIEHGDKGEYIKERIVAVKVALGLS